MTWVKEAIAREEARSEASASEENFYDMRSRYRDAARQTERRFSRQATEVATDALSLPQRKLKEAISGDESSFGLPDFSLDLNVGNRAGYRGTATITDEGIEPLLDVVVDPVNLVGAGLFTGGTRAVNKLTGPLSGRGMVPSSPANYIPNFYGAKDIPEGTAPSMFDEAVFKNRDRIASVVSPVPKLGPRIAGKLLEAKNPEDIMKGRARTTDFAKWMAKGAARAQDNLLSPEARALYRDTGINRSFRDDTRAFLQDAEAMSGSSRRPEAKALAQGQFNYLVGEQAGRQGARSEALEEIRRRSYLTEAVPFQQGSYSDLIMNRKLSGTVEDAKGQSRKLTPRKADLDFIEEHMGNVWRGRGDEKLKDSATPKLVIKTPTGKYTGNHKFDFQQKSGVFTLMKKIFGENKNPTKEEFYELLQKHAGDKVKIHPDSGSKSGYWVTGSFEGTAITEGGVNFIAKVQPNGRIMAVVSDEHNFLEKTPVVGKAVEEALPNRIVAATPPMFFDAKSTATTKAAKAETGDQKYIELLEEIARTKPRKEVLRAEQARQAGAGMLVGRMATGEQDDERR